MATAMEIDVECDSELMDIAESISVRLERITPELAKEMLRRNRGNRRVNERNVSILRQSLVADVFTFNGETIILDEDDHVLDGQHRLIACVESGVSFISLVVRGISRSVFDTIDIGRVRSGGDMLGVRGEAYSNRLAAAANMMARFIARGGFGAEGAARCPNRILAKVLDAHPGLRDSVAAMCNSTLYSNQYGVVLHYLFTQVSREAADAFARVITSGDSDTGRPFMVLRESIIRVPFNPNNRLSYAAKTIKAFNAEMAGERPKILRMFDREEMPTIHGLDYEKIMTSVDVGVR